MLKFRSVVIILVSLIGLFFTGIFTLFCLNDTPPPQKMKKGEQLKHGFNWVATAPKALEYGYQRYQLENDKVLYLAEHNTRDGYLFDPFELEFSKETLSESRPVFLKHYRIQFGKHILSHTQDINLCPLLYLRINNNEIRHCRQLYNAGDHLLITGASVFKTDSLYSYTIKNGKTHLLFKAKDGFVPRIASLPNGKVLLFNDESVISSNSTKQLMSVYEYISSADELLKITMLSIPHESPGFRVKALSTGQVFILFDSGNAYLFKPLSKSYRYLGKTHSQFSFPSIVELKDHRVLIAAGQIYKGHIGRPEIFDFTHKKFETFSSTVLPRNDAGSFILGNGSVLIIGGQNDESSMMDTQSVSEIELFLP